MTMRIEVGFPRPLGSADRTRFRLVVSTLAGTKRIAFVRGDHGAVVWGEALSAGAVRQALVEEGLVVETVASSLDAPDEAAAPTGASAGERYRPLGR